MIQLINNKKEQTGAVGVKCLRCSLSVSNPSHTHYTQTEVDGVNHTWPPLNHIGGNSGRCCHLSVQLARRHGQAERRLPAECPGHQQTFVLHLLQAHHHLLGTEGTDGLVKDKLQRITKDYNCGFSYYETKS